MAPVVRSDIARVVLLAQLLHHTLYVDRAVLGVMGSFHEVSVFINFHIADMGKRSEIRVLFAISTISFSGLAPIEPVHIVMPFAGESEIAMSFS